MALQLLGPSAMLLGLGASEPIDAFLLTSPDPSATDIAAFLKAFGTEDRAAMAQGLISRGVKAQRISDALRWLETTEKMRGAWPSIAGVLALASAAASGYHGYRRNKSVGWALWWFLMGSVFPVVTPVIAVAQGFGKEKK